VRPADANETAIAWRTVLEHTDRPAALCLTRQDVPTWDRGRFGAVEGTARGGYVLAEASTGTPELILIGTGSEVQIAVAARETLEADGVPTRVVSMPCREWFDAQKPGYQDDVLPPGVKARVSVEAGVAMSWRDLIGDSGECVSLEHFGASAPYQVLYERFGLTAEAVVAAARRSLDRAAAARG
jgi:transketolase